MAHLVEGVTEGAETGAVVTAPEAVDINQWLKANRLVKLKDYFEEMDIVMEVEIVYSVLVLHVTHLSYFTRIGNFNFGFNELISLF